MIVEMGKEYRIEGAEQYRLLAVDSGGECPVIGMVKFIGNDLWRLTRHTISGCSFGDGFGSLVEVKPRIKGEFWVVHRANGHKNWCVDYDHAERLIGIWEDNVIAITHHTYDCEEGEGLK